MRLLILKDKDIKETDLNIVLDGIDEIYHSNADIDITFTINEHDYTEVSGEQRYTFDSLPYGYIKKEVDRVHKRDNYAFDHIIFLVHRDNWRYQDKRVWGENFSNVFYDYHVEIVRFDNKNLANSIGTMYHEIHHSHDALIETELGVKVESIVEVDDWDSGITHGGESPWEYIRYKENTRSLYKIKSLLKKAYENRKQRHLKVKVGMLQQIVKLMQQLVILKRTLLIKNVSK